MKKNISAILIIITFMANLKRFYTNLEDKRIIYKQDKNYEKQFGKEGTVEELENLDEPFQTICESAEDSRTVIFIGDSFRKAMVDYLSRMYKKVYWVHQDKYKKEDLEKYNPDIVIYERVERNFLKTLTMDL